MVAICLPNGVRLSPRCFGAWHYDGSAQHATDWRRNPTGMYTNDVTFMSPLLTYSNHKSPHKSGPSRHDRLQYWSFQWLVQLGERMVAGRSAWTRFDGHLCSTSGWHQFGWLLARRSVGSGHSGDICESHSANFCVTKFATGWSIWMWVFTFSALFFFSLFKSVFCVVVPAEFLHLIFPSLVAHSAYELFYTYVGQHTSVGNYWNDPHQQQLYMQYSAFLPYINNEVLTYNSSVFREGLLRLQRFVLVGGPDDGVITPWQSSHFGYYDRDLHVVPVHQRRIYLNDDIGLRQLNRSERLVMVTKAGVRHFEWHTNVKVVREVILPYLD